MQRKLIPEAFRHGVNKKPFSGWKRRYCEGSKESGPLIIEGKGPTGLVLHPETGAKS